MSEDSDRISGELKRLEEKIDDQGRELKRLSSAILGDEQFGQWGYKDRIERAEAEVKDLRYEVDGVKNEFNKIYNRAIGASIAASSILTAVAWVISTVMV